MNDINKIRVLDSDESRSVREIIDLLSEYSKESKYKQIVVVALTEDKDIDFYSSEMYDTEKLGLLNFGIANVIKGAEAI